MQIHMRLYLILECWLRYPTDQKSPTSQEVGLLHMTIQKRNAGSRPIRAGLPGLSELCGAIFGLLQKGGKDMVMILEVWNRCNQAL